MSITFTKEELSHLQGFADRIALADTAEQRGVIEQEIVEFSLKICPGYNIQLNIAVYYTMKKVMQTLLGLLEGKKNVVMGELGCFTGESTRILAKYAEEAEGRLIVIDWFKGSKIRKKQVVESGFKEEFLKNMRGLKYTLMEMESGEAAAKIPDEFFDWFWIDADHRYSKVKRDIKLWYPKVKKEGVFAGHDYDVRENTPPYNEKFIEYDVVDGMHHGVIKAVNEAFGMPNYGPGYWWIIKGDAKWKYYG